MAFPSFFPQKKESITTFNFVDIASGTGNIDYYLARTENTGGQNFILTEQRDFSDDDGVFLLNSGDSPSDIDFDLTPLNLPRTTKGNAKLSIAVWSGNSGSIAAEVFIFDGSTETSISTEQTQNVASGVGARMILFDIPLTQTNLKKGDIIRLTVKTISVGGTNISTGIDPANRNNASLTITTSSKLTIPYRIDLS